MSFSLRNMSLPAKIGRAAGSFLDGILDRIFTIAGAVTFAQVPQLIQQYIDVLAGALMEAGRQYEAIRIHAAATGKTVNEFIEKHLNSSDPDFRGSGKIFQATVERYEELQSAYKALIDVPLWQKPFSFITHYDSSIMQAVVFEPGLPLNTEGLVYAVTGAVVGFLFYNTILKLPVYLLSSGKKKKELPAYQDHDTGPADGEEELDV